MMKLNIDVHMDVSDIAEKLEALKDDDEVMYEVHNEFARLCDPYVPMYQGVLSQSVALGITPHSITYQGPYAHYMYVGEVYGPNIPIIEDGIVVGWFSPPGQKKHPTGREINYNKEMHPLATKEWDKAMMADRGDEFKAHIAKLLMDRLKELYG